MTTSAQTEHLDHPVLRQLVNAANALTVTERMTLLKGLVPSLARDLTPREFEALMTELRLKGERYYEAKLHPGQGHANRHVIGERDLEGR
jgi:hypothetical protein